MLKPLVVGAPRSGFSLLISVINNLLRRTGHQPVQTPRAQVLERLVRVGSLYTTRRYRSTFQQQGIASNLVYNGEFHLLTGGPKWLDPQRPERACIRKYFGVRGMGDFLLVVSHPREILENDPVVHSHTDPQIWLKESGYDSFQKFTSIRNPLGIINSASFSLNAMASQYIQMFLPGENENFIRQRHGLYKLTDLEFFRGLVRFLKGYLEQYLPVREQYFVMCWEDLITSPVRTIGKIASQLQLNCPDRMATAIWKPMDHVNLTGFHQHNYRKGKGIVGDWKNSLVNEHLDVFREYGFDQILESLGYPPVPVLESRHYSPFQRMVQQYLRRGDVYRLVGDPDLFGFAFNKSNIDASKFGFKSFPAREWTRVERSTLTRDDIVDAVSVTAEDCCIKLNEIITRALEFPIDTVSDANRAIQVCAKDLTLLMQELPDSQGVALCRTVLAPIS